MNPLELHRGSSSPRVPCRGAQHSGVKKRVGEYLSDLGDLIAAQPLWLGVIAFGVITFLVLAFKGK